MGFQKNATVVFVPGAWADGSSWGTVINGVAEAGLGVICAPIPLTTLSDDIAAVRRVIARIDGPVVLVAHAYGGSVIAGVDDEKVKGLVYITALAPDEGEATVEVFTREAPHPDAPKMAPDENGYVWMPHEAILKAFSPNATADEQGAPGGDPTPNQRRLHYRKGTGASVEEEALVVSDCGRGSDDSRKDATVYGGAYESDHQDCSRRSPPVPDDAEASD